MSEADQAAHRPLAIGGIEIAPGTRQTIRLDVADRGRAGV